MCVIDRKTYLHPDGSQSTVESTRRCPYATGSGVCDAFQVRESQSAHLVERVPRASPREPSSGTFETEGFNGRKIIYRPVTGGTTGPASKRSSLRPAISPSSPSSIGSRYSPGASYVEVRPSPPTPLSAASSGRKRVSFQYEAKSAASQASTTGHGLPSPSDLPMFSKDGRIPYQSPSVESISSTSAMVDQSFPDRSDVDHRSSMREGYTSTRGSPSGPALSDLPKTSSRKPRPDSAKAFAPAESPPRAETSEGSRRRHQNQVEADTAYRRQREQDEAQAKIEQARLAASDQRQAERDSLARKTSRERHLRDAAAALEGRARRDQQQQADSEFAQMAQERKQAEQRRRGSQQYSPATSQAYTRPRLDRQPYSSPFLAASDQRQAERDSLARKTSRERHLRDAAAALEGRARRDQQQQADSEFAQMAQERKQAEQRRRGSQQYSPATSQAYTRPRLDRQPYSSPLQSPISPRGPMSLPLRSPMKPPVVHNDYPPPIDPTLRPTALHERGQDVIANEQDRARRGERYRQSAGHSGARRQTQRLDEAMRDMSFENDFVLFEDDDGNDDFEEYESQRQTYTGAGDDRARRPRRRRDDYYL
nr:hypothetical protein CFP56_41398 [Quercus suber]